MSNEARSYTEIASNHQYKRIDLISQRVNAMTKSAGNAHEIKQVKKKGTYDPMLNISARC